MTGPIVSGSRGPVRAASAPAAGEASEITSGSGSRAAPACVAL